MTTVSKFIKRQQTTIVLITFAVLAFFIFSSLFTYFYFASDLKSKDSIMNRKNTGIVLTDRSDKPFFTFYSGKSNQFMPLSKIPKQTQEAVIAAEDKEFYTHPGFSLTGIFRAFIEDLEHKDVVAGGSTITQQLVKNALLTPRRDFFRKFQEIILAQEIERRYTKDEILEMYLNSVYFGNGAFGIEEAAQHYFGKSASQLDVAQSAVLAGLLPAPSQFAPANGDDTAAKSRQLYVLNNMFDMKDITLRQKEAAYKEKLVFSQKQDDLNNIAPHFALMVRDALIKKYGEEQIIRSGYKVKTTLDLSKQKYAEQVVSEEVTRLARDNVTNGATVVMDPKTGEILALVGSKDWYNNSFGKVNMAISPRQPGSSFKPIVYGLAMEDGLITPATVLKDVPTTFEKTYKPHDYDNKWRGNVLVRRALANSLNVPAVEVMEKVGVPDVLDKAKELGITTLKTPEYYGPSLVLGTGDVRLTEMTAVYASFANKGEYNPPTSIMEIKDKTGKTVYEYTPVDKRVWTPEVAFLISSILSDNRARAEEFGNTLTINRTAAVKTGTTENYHDAWTLGYTPQLTVGVWVGNNNGELMDQVAGSLGAAPIWRRLMEQFLQDQPTLTFEKPENVVAESICSYNGLLATSATSSAKTEYFISGTQPTAHCYAAPIATNPSVTSTPPSLTPPVSVTQPPDIQQEQVQAFQNQVDDMRKQLKQAFKDNGREHGKKN